MTATTSSVEDEEFTVIVTPAALSWNDDALLSKG